jgi:small subunit ribosomal protein S20
MPLLPNAKKALRVSERRSVINARIRSRMKTMLKKFRQQPTASAMNEAFSAIDQAAKKNIIHKNKASRLKSQLSALLSSK